MKAIVFCPGDPTVGIFDATIVVDGLPDPEEERENWRALLGECFDELMDDSVDVTFEDECATCRRISSDGHSKDCPEGITPPTAR